MGVIIKRGPYYLGSLLGHPDFLETLMYICIYIYMCHYICSYMEPWELGPKLHGRAKVGRPAANTQRSYRDLAPRQGLTYRGSYRALLKEFEVLLG